ncbi:hypothetical protein HYDPIDRAFT_74350, partial [Hydnomerulius pinastri MD-312]
ACGELMLNIHPEQRVHIRAHKDDPIPAWKAIQALFIQQKPGMRFAAYDEFFSIRKRQDEALPSVAARVEEAMSRIQELRPKDFDLNKLDDELACMAMIRSLGPDFYHFTSSLTIHSTLDKDTVKAAFQAEEVNRK